LAFGPAYDFLKPKPPKARPKPGLSGQAGAGTSLDDIGLSSAVKVIRIDKGIRVALLDEQLDWSKVEPGTKVTVRVVVRKPMTLTQRYQCHPK
jgi:hypothetical protein